eukprot:SAG22_NODE_853_length_6848_cov_6.656394_3_plen_153_part_00
MRTVTEDQNEARHKFEQFHEGFAAFVSRVDADRITPDYEQKLAKLRAEAREIDNLRAELRELKPVRVKNKQARKDSQSAEAGDIPTLLVCAAVSPLPQAGDIPTLPYVRQSVRSHKVRRLCCTLGHTQHNTTQHNTTQHTGGAGREGSRDGD